MTQNLPANQDEQQMSIIEVTNDIDVMINKITTAKTELQKSVNMAYGVQKLKEHFMKSVELQKVVNHLAGTALGFKTDKDKDPQNKRYSAEIITENCIIALLSGYRLHGNEFNIIAGNFYPAKSGKFRKIIETDGLTNFREKIGMPKKDGGQAIMQVSATWTLNGHKDEFSGEVVVKIYNNSDTDYMIGKAQSKLYSRILTQLTGTFIPDADTDEGEEKRNAINKLKPDSEKDNPEVINADFEPIDEPHDKNMVDKKEEPKQEPKEETKKGPSY